MEAPSLPPWSLPYPVRQSSFYLTTMTTITNKTSALTLRQSFRRLFHDMSQGLFPLYRWPKVAARTFLYNLLLQPFSFQSRGFLYRILSRLWFPLSFVIHYFLFFGRRAGGSHITNTQMQIPILGRGEREREREGEAKLLPITWTQSSVAS